MHTIAAAISIAALLLGLHLLTMEILRSRKRIGKALEGRLEPPSAEARDRALLDEALAALRRDGTH